MLGIVGCGLWFQVLSGVGSGVRSGLNSSAGSDVGSDVGRSLFFVDQGAFCSLMGIPLLFNQGAFFV